MDKKPTRNRPPKIKPNPLPIRSGMLRRFVERANDRKAYPELLPGNFETEAEYRLAMSIFIHFLGVEWVEYYALGKPLRSRFLRTSPASGFEIAEHFLRYISLAEMLINFQYKENFEECLSLIAGGGIEEGYAELEVGRYLSGHNVSFIFNKRKMKRKLDYDLNILFRNGQAGCADTKCKIEDRPFNANSVYNSLGQARKQLPADQPGAIFIKTPQIWANDFNISSEIGETVDRFFGETRRVVLVTLYATCVVPIGKHLRTFISSVEITSNRHKFNPDLDWMLVSQANHASRDPIWWKSLISLINPRFLLSMDS